MRAVFLSLVFVASTASADANQDLIALERSLSAALARSDADTVDSLWADDLVWIGLSGRVSSKQEQLANMKVPTSAGAPRVTTVTNKDVKVRLYDKSAVVTVLSSWTILGQNGERATDYLATHVWTEQNGRWVLVSAHVSRVGQF